MVGTVDQAGKGVANEVYTTHTDYAVPIVLCLIAETLLVASTKGNEK